MLIDDRGCGPLKESIMSVDFEGMAKILEGTGDYRILRRLQHRDRFAELEPNDTHIGVVVDVETTGLDVTADEIVEIGLVKFSYASSGSVGQVIETFSSLNEPTKAIPPEIALLTGIQEEDVEGHRIDDAAVSAFVSDAEIVVAHNARFDRRMCEPHWQSFTNKPWTCSATDIKWRDHGFESSRLDHLLRGMGLFRERHRAIEDCFAVLELLAYRLKSPDRPAMALLIEQSRRNVARVWAEGTNYSSKDELKARGYRWNNGSDGRPKSWYRDLEEKGTEDEIEFLRTFIYRRDVDIKVQLIDALSRFSIRD